LPARRSEPAPALAACARWDGTTLVLSVRVQPRARRAGLGEVVQGRLRVALTAPPVDGKANAQAREVLAEAFGVGVSRVRLALGESSREKVFHVEDPVELPAIVRAG